MDQEEKDIDKNIIIFFFLLFFISGVSAIYADQNNTPEPYEEDEFPQWLKDLRRAEIIFFGSIPFSIFLSIEGYQFYRYFSHDMNSDYAPWPFQSSEAPAYTYEEQLIIIGTALIISGIIALADFIIGKIVSGEEERHEKLRY